MSRLVDVAAQVAAAGSTGWRSRTRQRCGARDVHRRISAVRDFLNVCHCGCMCSTRNAGLCEVHLAAAVWRRRADASLEGSADALSTRHGNLATGDLVFRLERSGGTLPNRPGRPVPCSGSRGQLGRRHGLVGRRI